MAAPQDLDMLDNLDHDLDKLLSMRDPPQCIIDDKFRKLATMVSRIDSISSAVSTEWKQRLEVMRQRIQPAATQPQPLPQRTAVPSSDDWGRGGEWTQVLSPPKESFLNQQRFAAALSPPKPQPAVSSFSNGPPVPVDIDWGNDYGSQGPNKEAVPSQSYCEPPSAPPKPQNDWSSAPPAAVPQPEAPSSSSSTDGLLSAELLANLNNQSLSNHRRKKIVVSELESVESTLVELLAQSPTPDEAVNQQVAKFKELIKHIPAKYAAELPAKWNEKLESLLSKKTGSSGADASALERTSSLDQLHRLLEDDNSPETKRTDGGGQGFDGISWPPAKSSFTPATEPFDQQQVPAPLGNDNWGDDWGAAPSGGENKSESNYNQAGGAYENSNNDEWGNNKKDFSFNQGNQQESDYSQGGYENLNNDDWGNSNYGDNNKDSGNNQDGNFQNPSNDNYGEPPNNNQEGGEQPNEYVDELQAEIMGRIEKAFGRFRGVKDETDLRGLSLLHVLAAKARKLIDVYKGRRFDMHSTAFDLALLKLPAELHAQCQLEPREPNAMVKFLGQKVKELAEAKATEKKEDDEFADLFHCTFCKVYGHHNNNCPIITTMLCFNCLKLGHTQRRCTNEPIEPEMIF